MEFTEEFFIHGEYSCILFTHYLGSLENIARTRVVSHTLIVGEELIVARPCEMVDGWILSKYLLEIWDHSVYLCLLEEYLREPDTIEECLVSVILSIR